MDEPTTVRSRLKATVVVLCSFQVEDKRPRARVILTDRLQLAFVAALKQKTNTTELCSPSVLTGITRSESMRIVSDNLDFS